MCGIAGILNLNGQPVENGYQRVQQMNRLLKHRGPDSEGIYVSSDESLVLGNTRLAIVDPHNPIKHPLESRDGKYVLSFNGEIYNYLEIKERLEQQGVAFRTQMDTEVFLEGLRVNGEEILETFDGMWAVAFYDVASRRLLLSRDLMGERHLYYFVHQDELIFASEVKPILAVVDRPFELDFNSFLTSLIYFAPAPGHSIIQGIQRLLPGHNLVVENGKIRQYRYRRLHPEKWFDFFAQNPSIDQVIEKFDPMFRTVCQRRLAHEVPYFCTLSGGLDSSVISLYASDFGRKTIRTLYGQSTDEPLRKGKDVFNEYQASQFTSSKLKTVHDHIYIHKDDAVPVIRELADNAFDGMFDSGVASFQMLAQHVRQRGAKVMLVSEGPDEFLGYPKDLQYYHLDRLAKEEPARFEKLRIQSLTAVGREELRKQGLGDWVVHPLFSHEPFRFSPIHESWGPDEHPFLLSEKQRNSISNDYGVYDKTYDDLRRNMDYTQWRALSYAALSLPDMFNLRIDKAYMKASIEARLPFQAPEVVEFMIAIPSRLRFEEPLRKNQPPTKYLLRSIVERHIGPQIAYREKYGFAAPVWLSPHVFKTMDYAGAIRGSSIFEDYPFKPGLREYILRPENKEMLWPFYVLARLQEQLHHRVSRL